jgi:hypothetical protein
MSLFLLPGSGLPRRWGISKSKEDGMEEEKKMAVRFKSSTNLIYEGEVEGEVTRHFERDQVVELPLKIAQDLMRQGIVVPGGILHGGPVPLR